MNFFLNVSQINIIKSSVSFLLNFSLFTFRLIFTVIELRNGLNKFGSLVTLFFKAVPINKMPPKSFFLMEKIIFFEENIIITEIIFFHILSHLFLWHFVKLLNNRERNVGNNLFKVLRDCFEILIDVSSIDGFLKIFIHLDNL